MPYIVLRLALGRLSRFTVFDRGAVDFIADIITILNYPRLLSSLYGRFLARLALKENTVYLYYADSGVLAGNAGVLAEFVFREYVVYSVLMRYPAGKL